MSVENFKIKSLKIKEDNPVIRKLLPTVIFPYEASFELKNVNVAIANAIRRTIMGEIPVKSLFFSLDDFETTDPFILYDFVLTRIKNIPIDQSIDINTTYSLNIINKTEDIMEVKSKDLVMSSRYSKHNKKYFNETFTITTLEPSREIHISKIFVKEDYANNHAGHTVAFNAISIQTDVEPYNSFTKKGIKSAIANPSNFKISFRSNGNMDAKDILKLACKEIINRLDDVRKYIEDIQIREDFVYLQIDKENDTIGNILMKSISDDYPDIKAVTYHADPIQKNVILRMRTNNDPKDILENTIEKNINIFKKI